MNENNVTLGGDNKHAVWWWVNGEATESQAVSFAIHYMPHTLKHIQGLQEN